MSSKTGQRATGRKPTSVRRQNAKTDGASGKEGLEQVRPGGSTTKRVKVNHG